jgi:hypothetical protein
VSDTQQPWTAYTIKITDPGSPYAGQLGRLKDEVEDRDGKLYFIRFPGGDGAWFEKGDFEDTEASDESAAHARRN